MFNLFFDDDELLNFLETIIQTKKYKYQVSSLLKECLKFVNHTIKKCLKLVCVILIELLDENRKLSPLEIETEIINMQSFLTFVQRGSIQRRYFLKQNILQYLSSKAHLMKTPAIVCFFKTVITCFEIEDKKLLSRCSFLIKNCPLILDLLFCNENDVSISSIMVLTTIIDRFPLFWNQLNKEKLNEFIYLALNEKTFQHKKAVINLLYHITKIASSQQIIEFYINESILPNLITLSEDDENYQQSELLDILQVLFSLMDVEFDYYDIIHEILIENNRIIESFHSD